MKIKDLAIFDQIPLNFFIKDEEGKYLWVNEAVCQLAQLGSREEIIGKTDLDLIWADSSDGLRQNDREVLETGKTFKGQESATLPSGEMVTALACKFVGELDGKKCLIGIAIMND